MLLYLLFKFSCTTTSGFCVLFESLSLSFTSKKLILRLNATLASFTYKFQSSACKLFLQIRSVFLLELTSFG